VVFGSEAFGTGPRGEGAAGTELAGTSFVLTRYTVRHTPVSGALGVVGPMRMTYAHTIALTRHVAATLGRLLEELLE
jgi:heat-inducible transcriptional repressor